MNVYAILRPKPDFPRVSIRGLSFRSAIGEDGCLQTALTTKVAHYCSDDGNLGPAYRLARLCPAIFSQTESAHVALISAPMACQKWRCVMDVAWIFGGRPD